MTASLHERAVTGLRAPHRRRPGRAPPAVTWRRPFHAWV